MARTPPIFLDFFCFFICISPSDDESSNFSVLQVSRFLISLKVGFPASYERSESVSSDSLS